MSRQLASPEFPADGDAGVEPVESGADVAASPAPPACAGCGGPADFQTPTGHWACGECAVRPLTSFTAAELQHKVFPPRTAYIEGLILEGLTVLGGKPKLGKSWLALNFAMAVATGGVAVSNPSRRVEPARVLYLALEDGPARLQDRLRRLIPEGDPWPENVRFFTEWWRLSSGGLDYLADSIDTVRAKVVIVDTLGRVRTPRKGRDSYQEDTDALSELHDVVRERPGLAVVVVHHNRKDDHPDDYIDALSGTTGISGVVDHIAVLQRGRGEADAVLRFTSRDAHEHDTAFSFADGIWSELGSALAVEMSKARRAVLAAVGDLGEAGLTDIAGLVEKDKSLTLRMLRGLESEGLVFQDGSRGPWKPSPNGQRSQQTDPELTRLTELTGFRSDEEGDR